MPDRSSRLGKERGAAWRLCAVLGLALALLAAPPPASAADVSEIGAAGFDLVILRPLNLLALGIGGVLFVVTAPLAGPFEGLETSWDVFIDPPYAYTFERPLGEL